MIGKTLCATAVALCLLGGTPPAAAQADAIADFYQGKTITAVVPFGSGGSYSLFSQMAARHMAKFIPGEPTIVPQHMPGAGGNKGTSYLYNVAPKDGSMIGMVPDGLVISSVLRPDQIKYKPADFTWIGSVERLPTVLMIRSGGNVKSVADLASRDLVVGSSGRGSGTYLFPSLLRWLTGGKVKIVQGYKGVRDMINAMERGEVQGTAVGYGAWLNLKADWLKSGYIVPLAQFGVAKDATLPDTPLAIDLGKTADAKAVARFMASNAEIGRGFVVPPKVPGDRITALRAAFDRMIRDPDFLADVKKRNLIITPAPGAEIQEAVERAVAIGARLGPIMRAEVFGGGKDK